MDTISVANMERTKDRKAKPTAGDKRAAIRINELLDLMPKEIRPSQERLAEQWMEIWPGETMTQSGISQYLGGKLPFSAVTVIRFARLLGCRPTDIRADLPELHLGVVPPRDLIGVDYFARKLADIWDQLTEEAKGQILAFALVNVTTSPTEKKVDAE